MYIHNMVVDNFDIILKHMSFESPDDFYFVQVFVRGKDGNKKNIDGGKINGNNKNRLVRFWTIHSKEELLSCKEDMINIANVVNGRIYIHPTKRSFIEVARVHMRLTVDTFVSENYDGLRGNYSSACGMSYKTSDKKYVIDVDDDGHGYSEEKIREIIDECRPNDSGITKVIYKVPTVHGYHLICSPFDVGTFMERTEHKITVQKNNPTLLYFNASKLI